MIVDELTGAFNRKYFNQTMKQLIADFRRTGRTFSLALLDLDLFKQINDTYGHLMGGRGAAELLGAGEAVHPHGGYLLPLWR
ncbi:GGDEF domain-containing protein [Paenibacillus rhizoplanae]